MAAQLWALSLLSALLQVLPFPIAGPVPLWRRVFCWFCLTPLLAALLHRDGSGRSTRLLQGAFLGYIQGVLWYGGNCYWIYRTMHLYGGIPRLPSFGILLLFSLYLGLYTALFGLLVASLGYRYSRNQVLCATPFLWVAVELARARITGFPWDLLGYTQIDNLLLIRLAPWTGVMGLSFVVAAGNALWLLRPEPAMKLISGSDLRRQGYRSSFRFVGVALATLVAVVATIVAMDGAHRVEERAPEVATLLQENLRVGSEASTETESKQQMLASFSQLSLQPTYSITDRERQLYGIQPGQTSRIIIWPEAPTDFVDSDPMLRSTIGRLAVETKAAVIVNDITLAGYQNGEPRLYNSASFFRSNGSYAGRYDKMHLVPFGEYVPYKPLFFFTGNLLDGLLFVPGAQRSVFMAGAREYGVFICYESIFGDELRHFPMEGAQALVNISDDGWYGDTSAPWEHLDMVRMRAVENHRWLLRATNTGVTAAIDPEGRVIRTIPRHIRASVQVPFGFCSDITFYSRHGDWFARLCALATCMLLLLGEWTARLPGLTGR
jgi:apolipoprotein N-acyltransferase